MPLTITVPVPDDDVDEPLLKTIPIEEEEPKIRLNSNALALQVLHAFSYALWDFLTNNTQACLDGVEDAKNSNSARVNTWVTIGTTLGALTCLFASAFPVAYGYTFATQGLKIISDADNLPTLSKGMTYAFGISTALVAGTTSLVVFELQPWMQSLSRDIAYLYSYTHSNNQTIAECAKRVALPDSVIDTGNIDLGIIPVGALFFLIAHQLLRVPQEPKMDFRSCYLYMFTMMFCFADLISQTYIPGQIKACQDGQAEFAAGIPERNVSTRGLGMIGGIIGGAFVAPAILSTGLLEEYVSGQIVGAAKHLIKGVGRVILNTGVVAGALYLEASTLSLLRKSLLDGSYATGYDKANTNTTFNFCINQYAGELPQSVFDAIDKTGMTMTVVSVAAMISYGFYHARKDKNAGPLVNATPSRTPEQKF